MDTLEAIFRQANDHRNLISDPVLDEVLLRGNSPFPRYDLSDFEEIPNRRRSGIAATWYADEKNGPRFHGRLTAIAHQFNTYAFTAAINERLQGTFPLGSYVKVRLGTEEVIVLINDTKGAKGIDLSKAAARDIGLTGDNARAPFVELIRVQPKTCDQPKSRRRHPMAQCYARDVYIEFAQSKEALPAGKVSRGRTWNFGRDFWRFAQKLYDLALHGGRIVRPFVRAPYVRGSDHEVKLTATIGPFENRTAARAYLAELCWPVENMLDRGIASFCRQATIRDEAWRPSANAIYYTPKSRPAVAARPSAKPSVRIASRDADARIGKIID